MPTAFKEWAVTVRALAEGEQLVTLRKGGIRETDKNFRLEHDRFFLYPTFDHQRGDLVRESHQPELRRALEEGVWPDGETPEDSLWFDGGIDQPDRVRIRAWAQVAAHFEADRQLAGAPSVTPEGPRFLVEPYLQYVTRTGITVMWETEEPCSAVVEYGTKFPPTQQAKAEKPDTVGEVRLANLEPNTKYLYRVVCTDGQGRRAEGKTLTFMTAPGANDAYSFAVIGDTQRNPVVTAKIAKLMWERRPNFVVHNGDVVNDGAQKWQWEKDLFKPCNELFGRVAVFPCIGNHEKDHPHYYKYFSLPKPEYHYSYTYGNAEFFVLDTNTKRDLKPDGEQYKWLEKALAASTAKWKVCYHHHPAYSSDSDDYGNTWKAPTTAGDVRVRDFVTLYEKYNVDVAFNGHIHLYERTWPVRGGRVDQKAGVVYVTSGGGGGSLEDFSPTPAFFKRQGLVDYHYCYVTVQDGTFNLKAFDQENRLFDEFTLTK